MVKSRWEQKQAALAASVPPIEVSPAQPHEVNPVPNVVARRRGRPKTRLSTMDELAEYLQISRSTIYRLIDAQQLPHLRIGNVLRFDLPTVLKWAANSTGPDDQAS